MGQKGTDPRSRSATLKFTCFWKFVNLLVLRIQDVYPGSDFFHPGSLIRIFPIRNPDPHKQLNYFNTKNCFWALGNMIRVVYPGTGYRIQIFLPIPDPWVKKAPDPRSGSATLKFTWFWKFGNLLVLLIFPIRNPDPHKQFNYFNTKNCFWALGNMIRVVYPGTIPFLPIPDPGVKKAPDPDP